MSRVVSSAFCLLVILGATALVSAKGATTRITISGAGLPSPAEIGDADVVRRFNVWAGPGTFAGGVEMTEGFIVDWAHGALPGRPDGLRTFDVSFYIRPANAPAGVPSERLAYVVVYGVDPATGQGYVYLPGKGDERYRLNAATVYRGLEGNWFRANATWQETFRHATGG